jgi:ubiquinone biosynthesis protein
MDFIDGVSLSKAGDAAERGELLLLEERFPGLRFDQALHNLAYASLHQLFVSGFFHADPHPGNILILANSRVAFVDFGIFGQLPAYRRDVLATYIRYLALGNIDESFRYYSRLYTATPQTDFAAFSREAKVILRSWYDASQNAGIPIRERLVGRFADEMLRVVRKHRLRMDMDTLLFWRVLIVLDATALRLSSHFDLLAELRSFFERQQAIEVERLVVDSANPSRLARLAAGAMRLPHEAETIVSNARGVIRSVLARATVARARAHTALSRGLALAAVSLSLLLAAASPALPPALVVALRVSSVVTLAGCLAVLLPRAAASRRRGPAL